MFSCGSLYGNFRTRKFTDIYPDYDTFKADYDKSPFANSLDEEHLKLTYYLLYANYGNSNIASSDENRFRFKLYSIIFSTGPSWAKRLEIQERLRGLSESDLLSGSKAIYNHSFNPSTKPSTSTLEELTTIDDQNTTNWKRSYLEAYSILWENIKLDVTKEYMKQFENLFLRIVEPELPLWYEYDKEDN